MTKDQALRLALDALEEIAKEATNAFEDAWCGDIANDALTAIKQALEQPDVEPAIYPDEAYELGLERIAYYTSPPKREWQGLTDEEQQELYDAWIKIGDGWGSFYALIEAKLKERNT